MTRPVPVVLLALLYFTSAIGIIVFLATDFTRVVPAKGIVGTLLLAGSQCAIGRGLWRLQNWARTTTIVLSAFLGFPAIMGIAVAFQSLDLLKLLLSLAFLTLQGMIIAYLLQPSIRAFFEVPITKLDLNQH